MRKGKLILVISIILMVGILVGCGNTGETASGDKQPIAEKEKEEVKKEEVNLINEALNTKNRSKTLEKYMRNPEEVKSEKFLCGVEVIDVKTDEKGGQIIYGKVIEPYQLSYNYNEYSDNNIKYVFIKYNSSEFDGLRVLKNDIVAFTGIYSNIYADNIGSERKEAPMFEADIRLNFNNYLYAIAMDTFISSIGQSASSLGLVEVADDDTIFNELLAKEENSRYKTNETMTYYKDNNDIYWLLAIEDAAQVHDRGVAIYVANKNSEGKYNIEYKSKIEFGKMDF